MNIVASILEILMYYAYGIPFALALVIIGYILMKKSRGISKTSITRIIGLLILVIGLCALVFLPYGRYQFDHMFDHFFDNCGHCLD